MGFFSSLFGGKKAPARPMGPEKTAPYPFGVLPDTIPGGQFSPWDNEGGEYNANDFPGNWPMGIPNVDSRGLLDQTGQRQPLPQTLANQLLNSPRTRYRPFTAHTFVKAGLPDPGAPQWTFDALGLVEFSPIGTGILNQGSLNPLEGAALFANQMVPMQGLGGIVQGGVVLQPLMSSPVDTAALQID